MEEDAARRCVVCVARWRGVVPRTGRPAAVEVVLIARRWLDTYPIPSVMFVLRSVLTTGVLNNFV